jgi:uncharacterized Ntn-hydrolase superfamily protein
MRITFAVWAADGNQRPVGFDRLGPTTFGIDVHLVVSTGYRGRMTFSIVARDPETGDLGIAVASKFLAVGAVVVHARAGVGAIATQALANVRYGPDGLALMAAGHSAPESVQLLTQADVGASQRQLGMVDAAGRSATYTGDGCITWAGGRTAEGVAAQGNLLEGAAVVDALMDTFTAGGLPFPELLLAALKAGDGQGGDRRGRQSAALLVVREGGGYGGGSDRWIDLRVDDHQTPIDELSHLLELNRLYLDRPRPEDLLPIDQALAAELRQRLEKVGYTPATVSRGGGLAQVSEALGVVRTGEPRPVPDTWDDGWQGALSEWMSVENLEERSAAAGWIDPKVVEFLRRRSDNP